MNHPDTSELSTLNHPVVSKDRWLAERKALLAREKELVNLQDQIAQARRALPWERIDKNYVFDAPEGKRSLADLFFCGGGGSGKVRAVRRPRADVA